MLNIGIAYRPIDPEIAALAAQHENDPEAILEIFTALQDRYGGLTDKQIADVARALGVSAEHAYGVASFYTMLSTTIGPSHTLRICDGPPCWLRGANKLREAADATLSPAWRVERNSCLGLCDLAPAALIDEQQVGPLTTDQLATLGDGWQGEVPIYPEARPGELRVMLAHAGAIDPTSLDSARQYGAYQALEKALQHGPLQVIDELEASGLRGRGGAGFPSGRKWRFVAEQTRAPKYIVCNADESEPLVFKDRVLMSTNPHQILEGMALAAYATGAEEGFVYIRGEYEPQAVLLERAIAEAEERHFLGDNILGKAFSFHVHVHRGAGAYICGEETALLNSLEGKRGEPRIRPPYPTVHGYHGLPTVVNNVETFAMVPNIIAEGAAWYKNLGHPQHPGTKLYTLLGHVNQPGLFEAPYGLTLRQIIDDYGGGLPQGSEFHFALTGGAAGNLVPAQLLDVPITYDSSREGVSLGAGAIMVLDTTISPVVFLRELLHFFEHESCGLCTPCRIGTRQVGLLLDRMIAGDGPENGRQQLQELASVLEKDSLCGLGQSAAWPINTALNHFSDAFVG